MAELTEDRKLVYAQLTDIFKDVFENPALRLFDQTTAKDITQWDSLNHINLVVAVEQHFKVHFNTGEVGRMANVGEFVDAILRKTAQESKR
jgi:acyl carrier protein